MRIVKKNMYKHVVLDKSSAVMNGSSIGQTIQEAGGYLIFPDRFIKEIKKHLNVSKTGRLNLINKDTGGYIDFDIKSIKGGWKVEAAYCQQKWLSGQNVYPVVSKEGDLATGAAHSVKFPFLELASKMAEGPCRKFIIDNQDKICWSRLDCSTYTKGIFNTEIILKYFTGICGRVEMSSTKALGVAQEIGFIFKSFHSTGGSPCGIRMEKMSGNFNTFTLSMYRKDLEIKDREKRGQKISEKEKEIDLGALASVLRIEGQIYPKTFYRGKCSRFRKIMLGDGGGKGKTQDYWHSVKFLEDSETNVEKLRQCLGEMSSQLGLHLIFSAWPYKSVESAVLALAETPRQIDAAERWIEDNESRLSTKGLSGRAQIDIAEFAQRVHEELGIDLYSVSLMTFGWIRNALLYSQLTTEEAKKLALLDPDSEEDHGIRKALVSRASKRAVLCRKQLLGLRDGFWMLADGSIPDITIN